MLRAQLITGEFGKQASRFSIACGCSSRRGACNARVARNFKTIRNPHYYKPHQVAVIDNGIGQVMQLKWHGGFQ
jgi:hypothetical protein